MNYPLLRALVICFLVGLVIIPIVFLIWLRKLRKIRKNIPEELKGGNKEENGEGKKEISEKGSWGGDEKVTAGESTIQRGIPEKRDEGNIEGRRGNQLSTFEQPSERLDNTNEEKPDSGREKRDTEEDWPKFE